MKRIALLVVLLPLLAVAGIAEQSVYLYPGTTFTGVVKFADGTAALPSAVFASAPTYGWYFASNEVRLAISGVLGYQFKAGGLQMSDATASLQLGSNGDITVSRAAAGAVKFTAAGSNVAMQMRGTQGTAPTCSSNCGTSPSVTGHDTAGIVTMGATGVPASGWVITFNGTWAAAPSCSVFPALAGMAAGKSAIVVATTTTTITVTTNGTAPATSDKYAYQCFGVS